MKPIKTLLLGASILAVGMAAGAQAQASGSTQEFVKKVSLSFPGSAAQIDVKNTSGSKSLNTLKLTPVGSNMDFTISGKVECDKGTAAEVIKYAGANIHFGTVTLAGDSYNSNALYADDADVAYTDKYNKVAEGHEDTFSVPLSAVKNGHPALRVDPVAEIEKAAQEFVNNGGKLVDFYRQDRVVSVNRPITLLGSCSRGPRIDRGYDTEYATIQINYKGDPELTDKGILNPKVGGAKGGIQSNQPLQIDHADFQANIPHYVGKCIPDEKSVPIQINLQLSGADEGYMDINVVGEGNTYQEYGTYFSRSNIEVSPATKKITMGFPLKSLLSQDKYSYMAVNNGATYSHNMKIIARIKSKDGKYQGKLQEFDTAVFKHTCKPQTSVPLGGTGKVSSGGTTTPSLDKIQPKAPGADPKAINKLQAAPVETKPARAVN